MAFVRQSVRTRPPFGEIGDPPLPTNGSVLYEEEYCFKSIPVKQLKHAELIIPKTEKRILKASSKKDLYHADFIERLIVGNNLSFSFILFLVYHEYEVISYRFTLCIKKTRKDKYSKYK
jgi:hypothetical protein